MRYGIKQAYVFLLLAAVGSCGPKEEPQPALPNYLRVPATLDGYEGSGQIKIGGGLTLEVEGSERLDPATNTWSGVLGNLSDEYVLTKFTTGQPRRYRESSLVPMEYRANGELRIINTISPGTYRMGIRESPGPKGEIADMTLNLPGPQIYLTQTGSLTIEKSTVIKTEGNYSLHRIQGSFEATLTGTGLSLNSNNPVPVTGSFDLLLIE